MSQPSDPIEVGSGEEESGPVPYALFLDYQESNVVNEGRSQGHRIIIKAKPKSGFRDALVFRYQQIEDGVALFTGVCSTADLVDYTDNPNPRDGFFRHDVVDLTFPAQSLAYEIRDGIIEELRILSCECFRIENSVSPGTTLEVSSDE